MFHCNVASQSNFLVFVFDFFFRTEIYINILVLRDNLFIFSNDNKKKYKIIWGK